MKVPRSNPSVVLDESDNVLEVNGRVDPYLEVSPGAPLRNVLVMAADGLFGALRDGLAEARQTGSTVRRSAAIVREDRTERVHVEIGPTSRAAASHDLVVRFVQDGEVDAYSDRATLSHLRRELASVRAHLGYLVAEHAAAVRELELAREELVVATEELHDTTSQLELTRGELTKTLGVLAGRAAVVTLDGRGTVLRFTDAARDIFLLTPDDVGRPLAERRRWLGELDLAAAVREVSESGRSIERDVADAEGRRFHVSLCPDRHPSRGARITLTCLDTTSIHRHLQTTDEARQHATVVVETAPNPLAVLDADLRVRWANAAFHALLQAADAIEGKPLLELARWEDPALADRLRLALEVDLHDLEVACRVADGTRRVLVLGARASQQRGERVLVLGALDVSDRVRGEEQRLRSVQLEEANRVKESLLQLVSHELRTPLNAISLWTRVLRVADVDSPRRLEAIEAIERGVRAEARLVDDLLDVAIAARPPHDIKIELSRFDPRPVVRAALEGVGEAAAAGGVTIEAELDERAEAMHVHADPVRLQQITWRLIENAIKFTPAGGRVHVSLARQGDEVELCVRDTGRGINPEFLPHLFQPFALEDASSTRDRDGLGVGLTLVRYLVERQGGRIAIASRGARQGAVVTVRLPGGEEGSHGHARLE